MPYKLSGAAILSADPLPPSHPPSARQSGSDTLTAQGCQKVRKVGRLYATEILESAVFPELLIMLRREPTSTTASNVLSALVALSSKPEGRQRVSMAGLMQIAYR